MSRYCGSLEGWVTPSNGLYECFDLSRYWDGPDRHPFLIHVDDELAGFVLVNKIGGKPEIDWNMGEFFIVSKFQKKGVIIFWNKVVNFYTQGISRNPKKLSPNPNHIQC